MIGGRATWFVSLGVAVVVGLVLGLDSDERWFHWPHLLGPGVAILLFAAGAAMGPRAIVLPFVGWGVFGLTLLIRTSVDPPNGDDQRALTVLFFTVLPVLFAIPAAVGVFVHEVVRARGARGERNHPGL